MNEITYCEKHQIDKVYLLGSQKYQCRPCNTEKMREYRKKNPEKMREACNRSAAKKREEIKKDKLENPEKYKALNAASLVCNKHNIDKVIGSDGRLICRLCKAESAKYYRSSGTNYVANRLREKLKKYNLTHDQYKKMIEYSNNKCYICGLDETKKFQGKVIPLSIDHCHSAEENGLMKTRGLLCSFCNTSLGGFKDDVNLLQKAIDYLNNHKDNHGLPITSTKEAS